jgi:uncharacterized protein YycO
MTLIFAHNDDWISRLIGWLTRSKHSHVALVSPDGKNVLEATGLSKPGGVRLIPIEQFYAERQHIEVRTIEHPFPINVWSHAWSQLGKPYDWSYLWGWLLHRDWQDREKWVCHELIVWAAAQSGQPLLEMADAHYLTPGDLYRISKPYLE